MRTAALRRARARRPGHAATPAVRQVPLSLAWAITMHKAQGASLEHVIVDLAGCFADGQAYVAVSRARCAARDRARTHLART